MHAGILREEPVGPRPGAAPAPAPAVAAEIAAAGIAVVVVEQAPGRDAARLLHRLAQRFPGRPGRDPGRPARPSTGPWPRSPPPVRDWDPTVPLIDVQP
jgi:hypothetical protein